MNWLILLSLVGLIALLLSAIASVKGIEVIFLYGLLAVTSFCAGLMLKVVTQKFFSNKSKNT